jgi:atypical dual specificity phosphatase
MNAVRPWLYVGKYRETLDASLLRTREIDAMLQLAEAVEHPGIKSFYLPVEDGVPIPASLLQQGVGFVLSEKDRGRTVLIACGAGISRSVSFAVAVLREAEGLSLLKAVESVRKRHPESMPHPALWQSLCDYYHEEVPVSAMLKVLRDTE